MTTQATMPNSLSQSESLAFWLTFFFLHLASIGDTSIQLFIDNTQCCLWDKFYHVNICLQCQRVRPENQKMPHLHKSVKGGSFGEKQQELC